MISPLEGALGVFLAMVLLGAAGHKLTGLDRAAKAAAGLIGQSSFSRTIAVLAAGIEAGLALAMLFPASRAFAAGGAACLWLVYALLLNRVARSGGTGFDCGCSFSRQSSDSRDQRMVAAGLAGLAAVLALLPEHAAPSFATVFAALGFFALYIAIGELLSVKKAKERLL